MPQTITIDGLTWAPKCSHGFRLPCIRGVGNHWPFTMWGDTGIVFPAGCWLAADVARDGMPGYRVRGVHLPAQLIVIDGVEYPIASGYALGALLVDEVSERVYLALYRDRGRWVPREVPAPMNGRFIRIFQLASV